MRFMILVPANGQSEAGVLPDEKLLFAAIDPTGEQRAKEQKLRELAASQQKS